MFKRTPQSLILKHLSDTQQQPFGIYSKVLYHWVEPRNLKPTSIQVLAVGYEVAPVNLIQSAIGVYTSYLFHRYYRIKGTIKAFHYLFTYWCIHSFFCLDVIIKNTGKAIMQLITPYPKLPNVNQVIPPKKIAPKIEAVIGAPCWCGCW